MKYFKTDGIRGVFEKELTSKLIVKIAKGIVRFYKKYKLKPIILVGNDTRNSCDYILAILETILLKHGIQIDNLGVSTSPCLAFITKKYNYPLSVMVTSSHNPYYYNGIKFFNANGEKTSENFEIELENLMDKTSKLKKVDYAKIKNVEKLKQDYIAELKNIKKFDFPCIFDCAFGATSLICKQLFPKQDKINFHPNGININNNAGCTHIEMLKSLCIKKHKIGFAFDGDGDRISFVSETGRIISGDEILFILSKFFQNSGDTLIGSIYTNTGLENCLKTRNIKLIRSSVGDKNIYKKMCETNSNLGGESCGHIILRRYTNTSDGMLVAIILANIIALSKLSIDELLKGYQPYHQETSNLNIENYNPTNELNVEILNYKKQNTKIIVRPSGTEPVLRLFVEDKSKEKANEILYHIKDLILHQQK